MKSASEIKSMMDMVKSAEEQYKTLREFDRILVEETYGFKLEEIEERLDGVTMESLYNLPVEEINEIFKSAKEITPDREKDLYEIIDDMDNTVKTEYDSEQEYLNTLRELDNVEKEATEAVEETETNEPVETTDDVPVETEEPTEVADETPSEVEEATEEVDDDELITEDNRPSDMEESEKKVEELRVAYERHNSAKAERTPTDYLKLRILEDILSNLIKNDDLKKEYQKIIDDKNEAIKEYVEYTHTPEYKEAQRKQYEQLEKDYEKETNPLKKRNIKKILDSYHSSQSYAYIFIRFSDDAAVKEEVRRLVKIFFSRSESEYVLNKYTKVMKAYGFSWEIYRAFLNIEEKFLPSEYHVYNNFFLMWVMRYISHMDKLSKTDKYMVSSVMMALSNLIYHRFDSDEDEKNFIGCIMKLEDYLNNNGYHERFRDDNSSYHPNISIIKKAEENDIPVEVIEDTDDHDELLNDWDNDIDEVISDE